MSGFGVIAARDLRDLLRGAAFRIVAVALLALAVVLAAGAALVVLPPAGGRPAPDAPPAPLLIGTMLYFASLLPFVVFIWVFGGVLLTGQRASGQLETLLATPLSARALWLGKTAAIVLPGLLIAAVSSALIASVVAAVTRARADLTTVGLTPGLLAVCWLGNPVLFAGLGALTIVLALRSSPEIAIVPSFALGFGLMVAVPTAAVLRVLDLSSWAFTGASLAAAGIEWTVVLLLARGLTKERIILSGRED